MTFQLRGWGSLRNLDLRTVLVLVLKDRPALLRIMSVPSEEAPVVLGLSQPCLLPGSARSGPFAGAWLNSPCVSSQCLCPDACGHVLVSGTALGMPVSCVTCPPVTASRQWPYMNGLTMCSLLRPWLGLL